MGNVRANFCIIGIYGLCLVLSLFAQLRSWLRFTLFVFVFVFVRQYLCWSFFKTLSPEKKMEFKMPKTVFKVMGCKELTSRQRENINWHKVVDDLAMWVCA
jgi:hypothetical protein